MRGITHNSPGTGGPGGKKQEHMKHILPIFTLALLGAAAAVFADEDEATSTVAFASPSNYYYDYYLDPPHTKPVTNAPGASYYEGHNQSDTFTYGTRDIQGNIIEKPDVFTVARESNWGNDILYNGNKDNFYRVDFADYKATESGTIEAEDYSYKVERVSSNTGNVRLYLTDFVSETVPQAKYPYNSSSNALFNMDIVEYGYRELTPNGDGTYTASEKTVSYDVLVLDNENGKIIGSDGNKYRLSDKVTPIDSIDYNGTGNPEDYMTRYKYDLGTFTPNSVIEIYLKDSTGREVYSFSSYEYNEEKGVYEYTPFDKTTTYGNGGATGGFGDGGYQVAARVYDEMLNSYYFMDKLDNGTRVNPEYKEESLEKFDSEKRVTLASGKAMPLSALTPGNLINGLNLGKQVQFGFYGVAVGSPLPGGLQLALIAGLFGLGFCYVRRRKAIAG